MRTIVMGMNIKTTYEVVSNKDKNGIFIAQPRIKTSNYEKTWEEICSYEGEPQYTAEGYFNLKRCIYISEDEEVEVDNQIFRADLGDWIQYTRKILNADNTNFKKCEKELAKLMKEYNKQMIENDDKAKAYCDLHKLDYAETDYDQLIDYIKGGVIEETESYVLKYEPGKLILPTPYASNTLINYKDEL